MDRWSKNRSCGVWGWPSDIPKLRSFHTNVCDAGCHEWQSIFLLFESDVIDLLLITRLLRIMLDMLAGDSIRGQFTGDLLPVAFCLYIEVEAMFGINCCLSHNCEFEFYRLSLSPEGDEIFPFSPSPGVQAFFYFLHRLKHRRRGFRFFRCC